MQLSLSPHMHIPTMSETTNDKNIARPASHVRVGLLNFERAAAKPR